MEGLTLENGTYYSKYAETDTKKCVINRKNRIAEINRIEFGDEVNNGFAFWTQYDRIYDPNVLCICGQHLEAVAYFIGRKGKNGFIRVCLGANCIDQLDKLHNTTTLEKMKKFQKICSQCNGIKNIKDTICKKCTEKKVQRELYTKHLEKLEIKLQYNPTNEFLLSLKNQLTIKGTLSPKQLLHLYK
jgi:hypothetical protein